MIRIDYNLTLPAETHSIVAVPKMIALRRHCSNRAFNFVGDTKEYEKQPVNFDAPVIPTHSYGFPFKLVEEGPEFNLKLMKFPDEGRAPLVWFAEGSVWLPKELAVSMYIVRYRAFMDAMEAAKEIGFNVQVSDEGGYWGTKNVNSLVSAIERDRKYQDPRESMVR